MAYIFSSAALLASVAGFFYILRYVHKRTRVERIPEETREAVNQIISEIDRVTDRDSLLVEERVAKLRKILEDVDKRLALLLKEQDARARGEAVAGAVYGSLGRKAASSAAIDTLARKALAEEPAPEQGQKPQAPPETGAARNAGHEAAPPLDAPLPGAREMAAQGIPPAVIAARLGKTITEVEMEIFLGTR